MTIPTLLTPWGESLDREHPLLEYPRPQLQRESYLNLNGPWDYAVTMTESAPTEMQGQIIVPFSPETPLSGVGHILQPGEFLWYRRSLQLPEGFCRERVLLHFGAVDQCCTLWVNGQKAGSHTGGYLPFTFDITDLLQGAELTLLLRVTDDTDCGNVHARGKQKLKAGGIWYTPQSGIWQTVWLESVPDNYLKSLRITPLYEARRVRFELCAADAEGANIVVRMNGRVIAEEWTDKGIAEALIMDEFFRPWSPEDPFLYDVSIQLMGGDTVQSYFAMRKFSLGRDAQGLPRLMLNGAPYFHNGLLDQGYWSDGFYTAPSDEAMIHDITEMKRLGYNMLRKHIKIEPLRWYYHCDRLGMLVWQDMVNGGGAYSPLSIYVLSNLGARIRDNRYGFFSRKSKAGREEYCRELQEMVELLYNCPSIAMWVPFNEGWGQFDANEAVRLIRSLDPTRTIDHASGWYDQGGGDLYSIHWYFRPYRHKQPKEEARAVCLTEYGGYSLGIAGHTFDGKAEFGYKKIRDTADFNRAWEKLMSEEIIPAKAKGLSAAVYTQVSDVEGELNGLLTYDRRVCKADEDVFVRLNQMLLEK